MGLFFAEYLRDELDPLFHVLILILMDRLEEWGVEKKGYHFSSYMVTVVSMSVTNWEELVKTGFEFRWQWQCCT